MTFTVRSSGEAAEALVAELKAAHPDRDVAIATLDLADKGASMRSAASLKRPNPSMVSSTMPASPMTSSPP